MQHAFSWVNARVTTLSALALALGIAVGHTASASQSGQDRESIRGTRVSSAQPRLNLLTPIRADKRSMIRSRSLGDGSYICTPAGFGQRSRCYRN